MAAHLRSDWRRLLAVVAAVAVAAAITRISETFISGKSKKTLITSIQPQCELGCLKLSKTLDRALDSYLFQPSAQHIASFPEVTNTSP